MEEGGKKRLTPATLPCDRSPFSLLLSSFLHRGMKKKGEREEKEKEEEEKRKLFRSSDPSHVSYFKRRCSR